jgi:hypothetical protein
VFSTLNEAFYNIDPENFAVIFNKASKRMTPKKLIEWYTEALRHIKADKLSLPQLTMKSKFLIIKNDEDTPLEDIPKVIGP